MLDIQKLITTIKTSAISGGKSVLTGRNALVRDTFDFLFQRTKFSYELLLLCTKRVDSKLLFISTYGKSIRMFHRYKMSEPLS